MENSWPQARRISYGVKRPQSKAVPHCSSGQELRSYERSLGKVGEFTGIGEGPPYHGEPLKAFLDHLIKARKITHGKVLAAQAQGHELM